MHIHRFIVRHGARARARVCLQINNNSLIVRRRAMQAIIVRTLYWKKLRTYRTLSGKTGKTTDLHSKPIRIRTPYTGCH
jgi:hypothetical protein